LSGDEIRARVRDRDSRRIFSVPRKSTLPLKRPKNPKCRILVEIPRRPFPCRSSDIRVRRRASPLSSVFGGDEGGGARSESANFPHTFSVRERNERARCVLIVSKARRVPRERTTARESREEITSQRQRSHLCK